VSVTPEIIDADECAELLRCSVMQVEEGARDGRLPGFKEGRSWLFVRADLLAYLAERARREAAERQAKRNAEASGKLAGTITPVTRQSRRPAPKLPLLSS